MFKLVMALIGTMLANIFLGASLAQFKAGCIIIGFLLMIGSAYLSEDIIVASLNGNDMNLLEGMRAIVIAGIILYGGNDLIKLASLFNIKTIIETKEVNKNEQ